MGTQERVRQQFFTGSHGFGQELLPFSPCHRAGDTTEYRYDLQGRVIRQFGSSTYPVAYAYDAHGQLSHMKTFRAEPGATSLAPSASSDGSPASLPAEGDLTTWSYHPATGALLAKTDALGAATTYSYFDSGLLQRRTWARGVTTTYAYDDANRLSLVSYSDGTPSVAHTYYRTGERASTVDVAGLHRYVPPMLLLSSGQTTTPDAVEQIVPTEPGMVPATITEKRDAAGRRTRWMLEVAGQTQADMAYAFDDLGRLASAGYADGRASWAYSYLAGTALWSNIEASFQDGATVRARRDYDSRRRVAAQGYRIGTAAQPVMGQGYSFDPLRPQRRTGVTSLVPGLPGWAYGYDARGQVTDARRTAASAAPVPGQSWGFSYDAIGNRLAATRGQPEETATGGQRSTAYTTGAANAYTSIARPNAIEITGIAQPSASLATALIIRANGQPSGGQPAPSNGEPGGYAIWLDGQATARSDDDIGHWPMIDLEVSAPAAGPNGSDITSHSRGRAYVAPALEQPEHDADGNLTQDARHRYHWDAENRLITVEMRESGLPTTLPLLRTEFSYDAQGRRLTKRVNARPAAAAPGAARPEGWVAVTHRRFWYDGWNLVAETTTQGVILRRYLWGSDLSGSLQGAGGVGGLLSVEEMGSPAGSSTLYAVCSDANGNVIALIDGQRGALVARFDYDPFGNQVTAWTAATYPKDLCPFRFSSKYTDEETGLVYYGYRYYSPEMGRWVSRDPIGEEGGINLYGMVGNDSVNSWDYLGLWKQLNEDQVDAKATFEAEAGDSLKTLAEKRGLRANEFRKWATAVRGNLPSSADVKCSGGCQYQVPNTVLAYWAGAAGRVGRWWVSWGSEIRNLKKKKYLVVERRHEKGDVGRVKTLLDDLRGKREAHGLYFWGHGGSGNLTSHEGGDVVYHTPDNSGTYHLGLTWIMSCEAEFIQKDLGSGERTADSEGHNRGTRYPIIPRTQGVTFR